VGVTAVVAADGGPVPVGPPVRAHESDEASARRL